MMKNIDLRDPSIVGIVRLNFDDHCAGFSQDRCEEVEVVKEV